MSAQVTLFGQTRTLEIEEIRPGLYQTIDYCVLVKNRTGKTSVKRQIKLIPQPDGTFALARVVYLNRQGYIVAWVD